MTPATLHQIIDRAWYLPLWGFAIVVASVVYRRSKGKPILFFGVSGADFIERTASGSCTDSWWRSLGGANGCLVVAIAKGRLIIRPFFPFNLMFLPELYRFEHDVPLDRIVGVTQDRFLFRRRVCIVLRDDANETHGMGLFLKQPDEFVRQLSARA